MSDEMVFHIVGNVAGATSAINSVNNSTKALSESFTFLGESGLEAGNQIAEGMQKAEYSTMEARHAAMLFGEETGVRIPRALSGIAARSEVLGPLLAKAFSGIALIAFAELAAKAAEKFSDWYVKTFILTEAVKALDSALAKDNKTILDTTTQSAALKLKFEEIGLTAQQLTELKMDRLVTEIKKTDDSLRSAKDQLYLFRTGMTSMSNAEEARALGLPDSATADQITAALSGKVGAFNATIKEQQDELTNLWKENELQKAKASKEAHDKEVAGVMEYAKAGVFAGNVITEAEQKVLEKMGITDVANTSLAGHVKLTATQQAEAIGLVAEAHRKLDASITTSNLDEELKKQLADELKVAEAIEKDAQAQLKLNAAIMRAAAERQADVVAQDKASGNTAKMVKDEQTLIELLKKQENAELAIVDAKIQEAQAAMQVAFASGGLGSADFANAEAAYRTYQAQRVQIAAQADKQIAAASDNELKQETKALNTYLKQGNSQFGDFFSSVAMGHETLGKAAIKLYDQMGTALMKHLAMAAAGEIEGLLLHKTVAAEKQLTDAKGAAAGAYNALAGVPFIGPIIAPIAAAVAFAAVMAFDKGGMVPDTGSGHAMAVVQGGERVLTRSQNEALEGGLSGNKAPVVAHFTFEPTINNPFNAEKDGAAMMKYAQKAFKRMGVNL